VYELAPDSGVLFQNRDKRSDRSPNLTGAAFVMIDGTIHRLELAAWTRQSEIDGKYLSLSVRVSNRRPNAVDLAEGQDIDSGLDAEIAQRVVNSEVESTAGNGRKLPQGWRDRRDYGGPEELMGRLVELPGKLFGRCGNGEQKSSI
jgi:hypothetical protein